MQGWLAGIMAVVVLLLSGVGALYASQPRTLANWTGVDVIPEAGSRESVTLEGTGQHATVENALMIADELPLTMSMAAVQQLPRPRLGGVWWRSSVVGVGGDAGQYALYSATPADGVRLYVDLSQGLTFQQGLQKVPPNATVGATWTDQGTARTNAGEEKPFRFQGRIDKADTADCFRIESTLTLGSKTTPDSAVWCKGRGQVSGQHGVGVRYQPDDKVIAAQTAPGRRSPATISGNPVDYRLESGDPAFGYLGSDQLWLPIESARRTVTGRGDLIIADEENVASFRPAAGEGSLQSKWWAQPGGTILSLSVVEELVLVTTSEREIVAYEPNGRRAWSRRMTDISYAGAVSVDRGQLAVPLVNGDLLGVNTRSGVVEWKVSTDHPITKPVTVLGRQLGVLHDDHSISLIDLGAAKKDAKVLWTEEAAGGAVALVPVGADQLVNISSLGAAQWRSREDGSTLRESLSYGESFSSAATGDRTVGLTGRSGAVFFDPQSLAVKAKVPGATAVTASGTGFWAVKPGALLELDGDGRTKRTIPISIKEPTSLFASTSGWWILESDKGITCVR